MIREKSPREIIEQVEDGGKCLGDGGYLEMVCVDRYYTTVVQCSGRDLNPGSATRKATMLDRIVQLELINYYTTGATVK